MILNRTMDNRFSFFHNKISVQANSELFIGVRRTIVEQLTRPYSNCDVYLNQYESENIVNVLTLTITCQSTV